MANLKVDLPPGFVVDDPVGDLPSGFVVDNSPELPSGFVVDTPQLEFRAAKPLSWWEQVTQTVKKPFMKSSEELIAESQNIYALSKALKKPVSEITELKPGSKELQLKPEYEAELRNPAVTGIQPQYPTNEQFMAGAMLAPIGAGIATYGIVPTAIATVGGMGAFAALDKLGINLTRFVPSEANDTVKTTIELADFLAKSFLLVKGGKKLGANMPKIRDKYFRTTLEQTNLPKTITLPYATIRETLQKGGLMEREVNELVSVLTSDPTKRALLRKVSLGGKGEISIEFPANKVITLTDKPWWGKVKGMFKAYDWARNPSPEIRTLGETVPKILGETPPPPTPKGPTLGLPFVPAPPSLVPQFKNTEEALAFGQKATPDQILELGKQKELLQKQYGDLLEQGKDSEAFTLATGQKQLVNEALAERTKLVKKIVEAGGGTFRNLVTNTDDIAFDNEPVIYFDNPHKGTHTLKLSELTPEAVKAKVDEFERLRTELRARKQGEDVLPPGFVAEDISWGGPAPTLKRTLQKIVVTDEAKKDLKNLMDWELDQASGEKWTWVDDTEGRKWGGTPSGHSKAMQEIGPKKAFALITKVLKGGKITLEQMRQVKALLEDYRQNTKAGLEAVKGAKELPDGFVLDKQKTREDFVDQAKEQKELFPTELPGETKVGQQTQMGLGETKTQKEIVKEVVAEGPKTIQEVAGETGILEPNVRRILGMGTKEGVFERVDKGVYVIKKANKTFALVQVGDALEVLPKLIKDGFKMDMIFLDIPYSTPAVRGGGRGVKYDLISVDQFKTFVGLMKEVMRTPDTPVLYMYSKAPSGMKQMLEYNQVLFEAGFKPVAKGNYQKTYASGKPVGFPTVKGFKIVEPEGIILWNKSGVYDITPGDLNFKMVRPKGYATEKPEAMLRKLIRMTTKQGEVVFDPFAGSGSTLKAALDTGRSAVGIEKSQEAVEKYIAPKLEEGTKLPLTEEGGTVDPNKTKEINEKLNGGGQLGFVAKGDWGTIDIQENSTKIPFCFQPVEVPEIYNMIRDLPGLVAVLVKKLPVHAGLFAHLNSEAVIKLLNTLFRRGNEKRLAVVLAHESGHFIDWLPDFDMKRGNVLGRLKTLHEWMKSTISPKLGDETSLDDKVRVSLRNQAKSQATREMGKNPDKDLLNERTRQLYQSLLQQELERRGLIAESVVRKEMMAVTQKIHPFDRELVSKGYLAYRDSAVELMADTMSMLLNSPGTLEKMAPVTWKTFMENLDAKPEVKVAYMEVQRMLSLGPDAINESRYQRVIDMFESAEAQRIAIWKADEGKKHDIWLTLKMFVLGRDEKLRALMKGKTLTPEQDPINRIQMADLASPYVMAMMAEYIDGPILRALATAGVDMKDFGAYLFLRRIVGRDDPLDLPGMTENHEGEDGFNGFTKEELEQIKQMVYESSDRKDIANPLMFAPKNAKQLMEYMAKRLGPEAYSAIEKAAQSLYDVFMTQIDRGVANGRYSPEDGAKLKKNNSFYVTFGVVEHLASYVSSAIIRSRGTVKDVESPFITSVLKLGNMMRDNLRQEAKASIVKFLKQYHPGEFKKTKFIVDQKGRKTFFTAFGKKTIYVWENGKRMGYDVDPYIADSINNDNDGDILLSNAINTLLQTPKFKGLYVTYNLQFGFYFNLFRDIKDTINALQAHEKVIGKKVTVAEVLKEWIRAIPDSYKRQRGEFTQAVSDAMKAGALDIPFIDFDIEATKKDDVVEYLLSKYGLRGIQKTWLQQYLLPVSKILDAIKLGGSVIEASTKILSWKLLKRYGVDDILAARIVREDVGTPYYKRYGLYGRSLNSVAMFFNVWKESQLRMLKLASKPTTRSGYWWSVLRTDLLWKFLMKAGALGLLGTYIKSQYDRINEYDKTNSIVIPFPGETSDGRPVYIRVPHGDMGRLVSAIFWKMMGALEGKPEQFQQIFSFMWSQTPNVVPMVNIFQRWSDYFMGRNPIDEFTGRPIIPDEEYKAGIGPSFKAMAGWTINQSGQVRVNNFPSHDGNIFETILRVNPATNRIFKIGNTTESTENIIQTEQYSKDQRKEDALMYDLKQNFINTGVFNIEKSTDEFRAKIYGERWNTQVYQGVRNRLISMSQNPKTLEQVYLKQWQRATTVQDKKKYSTLIRQTRDEIRKSKEKVFYKSVRSAAPSVPARRPQTIKVP